MKLTDRQRKEIIAAAANGESKRSIARRYHIAHGTVTAIIKAEPNFDQICAHKKEENAQAVLAYMDDQKSRVCAMLDSYLDAMQDPDRIAAANLTQLATAMGILIDKYTANESKKSPADESAWEKAREILAGVPDCLE